jgi:glycosyltransferase involved in cell wall biosynthesis
MRKIIIVIPMYNCEQQIGRVLEKMKDIKFKEIQEVLIIDNQSIDNTVSAAYSALNFINSEIKVTLIQNVQNYGFGGSMKVGFEYSTAQGYEYALILHGDDQADIREIIPLLSRHEVMQYDCILGARFMNLNNLRGYSKIKTYGNIFFNKIFSYMTGRKIPELGSGLIAYRLKNFDLNWINKLPDDTSFVYVMLLQIIYRNLSLFFFPISWREEDQMSNVKLFKQTLYMFGYIFGYFLSKDRFVTKDFRYDQNQPYKYNVLYQLN